MSVPITVPRLGWSMEEGTFVEWLKRDGETIRQGDPLFVLESDKSAETVEALDEGTLRLLPDSPKGGETVKVGQVIAEVGGYGEAVVAQPPHPPAPSPTEGREGGRMPAPPSPLGGEGGGVGEGKKTRPRVTPRARRVARELGINPASLTGTGRNGRVRERDVRQAAPSAAPAGRLIPHTSIRKAIAARMVAGVTHAAPVTLTTKADVTNLVNLREQFRGAGPEGEPPSYTAFLLKLAAVALRQHPMLQAQWRDGGLFVPDGVHVAVAVDAEDGLRAPVVRDVDRLPLREIARRVADLAARARSNALPAEEMHGATFTLTNLGTFGIDAFTPVITLPQCAVLGVGRIVQEPAVVAGQVVVRGRMTLSLTFDHRVVDGAPAARFLDTLRGCIEQPAPWLIT